MVDLVGIEPTTCDTVQPQQLLHDSYAVEYGTRLIANRVGVAPETEAVIPIDILKVFLLAGVAKFVEHQPIFFVCFFLPLWRLYVFEVGLNRLRNDNLATG